MTEDDVRRIVREELERENGKPRPPPVVVPSGCVCPPTAELTCGSVLCPRRGPRGAVYVTTGIGG